MKTGIPPIPHEEIERLLASSADTIHRYEAIICVEENGGFFSGVFAEPFGYKGILSAGHCAMDFLAGEKFVLLVSETLHHLSIQSESVEHVSIGLDGIERPSSGGPDLSFVIIRDERLIHLIESQGYAFYNLDDKRPEIEAVFAEPVAKFNWCVAGGPKTMVQVTEGPQKLINANAAAMQCNLVEIELHENNFDYVKLRILSNAYGFPSCYDGVSGAGFGINDLSRMMEKHTEWNQF